MSRTSSNLINESKEFLEDFSFEDEVYPNGYQPPKPHRRFRELFVRNKMRIVHTIMISISLLSTLFALSELMFATEDCLNKQLLCSKISLLKTPESPFSTHIAPYTAATGRDFEKIIRTTLWFPKLHGKAHQASLWMLPGRISG